MLSTITLDPRRGGACAEGFLHFERRVLVVQPPPIGNRCQTAKCGESTSESRNGKDTCRLRPGAGMLQFLEASVGLLEVDTESQVRIIVAGDGGGKLRERGGLEVVGTEATVDPSRAALIPTLADIVSAVEVVDADLSVTNIQSLHMQGIAECRSHLCPGRPRDNGKGCIDLGVDDRAITTKVPSHCQIVERLLHVVGGILIVDAKV